MATQVRAWLVVIALACALLLLRSTGAAGAGTPQATSSGAAKPKCLPSDKNDKACRVSIGHDPENQEESAFNELRDLKAPAGAPDDESDDDYSNPTMPYSNKLTVVGH